MKTIAFTVAALGALAASAQAQTEARTLTPRNEGFMLGAHTVLATGVTISGPGMRGEIRTDTGEGVGVQIGYGFSPRLLVYASADVARQGTDFANVDGEMGLAHVELGGRLTFPEPSRRWAPYATVVVGKRGLAARSDGGGISAEIQISGTEVGAGGGILYALSPALSLDAAVLAARGKLSRVVLSGDVRADDTVDVNSSNTVRLKVGVNWHP
jgi:hypothetical protein